MPKPAAPRILVVDDEIILQTALCNGLKDKGYEAVGFTSAVDAVAALQGGKFEVLLTDLMMPGMDGITLLREALKIDPNLVTMVLTGEGTITTAVEAMKIGAMDYILKPFKLSLILPLIARALELRGLRLEKAEVEEWLRQRTAELEVANRELKAANQELDAFAHSIAHDLRAPLRAIQGLVSIAVDEYSAHLPCDVQGLMTQVLTNAEKMKRMMEDLLRLSRIGQSQLSKKEVQTSLLVNEVVAEVRSQFNGRAIEVRIGKLPACSGDAALLKQALFNLVSNAFKFTQGQQQALVEIGYEAQGGRQIYFVRDNGVGFDMRHAEKLFGVFERLHTAREFEGTGVGLSIVRRIVERHGGSIWAEAAVGQGATFYFTLDRQGTVNR